MDLKNKKDNLNKLILSNENFYDNVFTKFDNINELYEKICVLQDKIKDNNIEICELKNEIGTLNNILLDKNN